MTRLVRRFSRRRNMSSNRIHCCYIIIGTEFKEKHIFEKDELFCCAIISSVLSSSLRILDPSLLLRDAGLFLSTYLGIDSHFHFGQYKYNTSTFEGFILVGSSDHPPPRADPLCGCPHFLSADSSWKHDHHLAFSCGFPAAHTHVFLSGQPLIPRCVLHHRFHPSDALQPSGCR